MANMYGIQEIRILPMDKKEEFKTENDVRKFLSTELIEGDGKYYYRKRGINIENRCALILFQYNKSIIGYGILHSVEKDELTGEINGKAVVYHGYLQFLTMSIHNISNIALEEIQEIDENITHFSNPKWYIGIEHYDKIYALLLQKQIEFAQHKF